MSGNPARQPANAGDSGSPQRSKDAPSQSKNAFASAPAFVVALNPARSRTCFSTGPHGSAHSFRWAAAIRVAASVSFSWSFRRNPSAAPFETSFSTFSTSLPTDATPAAFSAADNPLGYSALKSGPFSVSRMARRASALPSPPMSHCIGTPFSKANSVRSCRQNEWIVQIVASSKSGGRHFSFSSASRTRFLSSAAAFSVNVTRRISRGEYPFSRMSFTTMLSSAKVLPVPADASTMASCS